jgi:hypothetical protein
VSTLLEVLLVNLKFLSNLGATLLGKDVLELDVQLFFLLNEHVFFRNFFCFDNQSLLQTLDLLDHFVCLWVSALELSPSVHVEGLLKLV